MLRTPAPLNGALGEFNSRLSRAKLRQYLLPSEANLMILESNAEPWARSLRQPRTKIHFAIVVLLCAISVATAGCAITKERMTKAFANDLRRSLGLTLPDLQAGGSWPVISSRTPSHIETLSNGNVLYIYDPFWGPNTKRSGPCVVSFEFESKEMRVLTATAEGDGCYRTI